MLLYMPIFIWITRKDIESRRLSVTHESVNYKTAPPVHCCCCCGVNMSEKHVLLPLVTDVIIEQGCLQAKYNVYSISIENAGQGPRKGGSDVSIKGISDPRMFKKIVLSAASAKRAGKTVSVGDVDRLVQEPNTGASSLYPQLFKPLTSFSPAQDQLINNLNETNRSLNQIVEILKTKSQ
eukprot:TRINITY_DN2006_c0_g1_i2.p1 TRINITY_DN2006_c0_g1~~TRINITY_DN2006_c0_g1_i2.p1  ORF type:complete len:180 (-),score=25.10 TRINITY_DN2006_c0_g1_i2:18-557(-)